jgi:menaquinone-9 beta-reductase
VKRDALVVGGGPAGLAAAIALRLQGLAVELMEPMIPPIDKACGEGILTGGIVALRTLGVRLSLEDGVLFRGVRSVEGEHGVNFCFSQGPGLAVRRTRLHELLVERAAEIGVQLRWGCKWNAERADYRWIIGADGQNSRVRRLAGLDRGNSSLRFGFRRHYRVAPWTGLVEVHWGARCQAYVTPVNAEEVGVALLSRDSHLRVEEAASEFPELAKRLRGAESTSTERGAMTASRRLRRVFRGTTVLVGDASGSVDAITGAGLTLAFEQALALGSAVAAGDLARYQAEHQRLMRQPRMLERGLMWMEKSPWLRKRVWSAAEWIAGPWDVVKPRIAGSRQAVTGHR